jgi:alcohol dehydrogenase (NADP+)
MAKKKGAGHVVVSTVQPEKHEAASRLGADEVVVSTDPAAKQKLHHSLDYILLTIPVPFDNSSTSVQTISTSDSKG